MDNETSSSSNHNENAWWVRKRQALLDLAEGHLNAYVYDLESVEKAAQRILALDSASRILYAVKANFNDEVIRTLAVAGVDFDCVSPGEVLRLRDVLAGVRLGRPRIPVVSNVDARPHDDPEEIRSLLVQQVCSPVRWEDSMRYLLEEVGIGQFYEIGPGRVLTGLLKRIARKMPCENIPA